MRPDTGRWRGTENHKVDPYTPRKAVGPCLLGRLLAESSSLFVFPFARSACPLWLSPLWRGWLSRSLRVNYDARVLAYSMSFFGTASFPLACRVASSSDWRSVLERATRTSRVPSPVRLSSLNNARRISTRVEGDMRLFMQMRSRNVEISLSLKIFTCPAWHLRIFSFGETRNV
jgi:hypothetical protein